MLTSELGPMLPSHQYSGFLSSTEADDLLGWALDNHVLFKPAKLTGGVFNPDKRRALKLSDLGPHRAILERRVLDRLPDVFRDTGTRPFRPDLIELELTAHGEGAFFRPHSDIPIGVKRGAVPNLPLKTHDRLVSAVLYIHRRPKSFSGGELRLYRVGDVGGEGEFKEFQPEHNSLVAFPAWAFHEVREVRCPGNLFENSRFAVNVWLCRNHITEKS